MTGRDAGTPPPVASGSGPVGRGRFETKEQRGRFLLGLAALVLLVGGGVDIWSSRAVARRVDQRRAEIRRALEGRTAAELAPAVILAMYRGGGEVLPGGPYDLVRPSVDAIVAFDEVSAGPERRCIRVHLSAEGALSLETSRDGC